MQRESMRSCIKSPPLHIFAWNDWVVLFFLFLASMNFKNWYVYLVFAAFVFFLLLNNRQVRIDTSIIPLICFSFILLLFWPSAQISLNAMLKVFIYPMCYLLGYNMPAKRMNLSEAERATRSLTIVLAFGALVHLGLNMISNWGSEDGRNTLDFWAESVLSATNQAALAIMMLGVAVALLLGKFSKGMKFFALSSLAVIVLYNLQLAGRTLFVLIALIFVVGFVYQLLFLSRTKQSVRLLLGLALLAVLLIAAYQQNVFGLKDLIENSNFYDRFFGEYAMDLDEDGRIGLKSEYLKLFFAHPWGGSYIHNEVGGYAHDLYLDTYDEAGIFALLSIVVIVVGAVLKLLKVIRSKAVGNDTKLFLVCVYFAVLVEFMIEPILAGVPWLLACFCAIYGSTSRMCKIAGGSQSIAVKE